MRRVIAMPWTYAALAYASLWLNLSSAHAGGNSDPVVDLTKLPSVASLNSLLKSLAQGNKGEGGVRSLKLNRQTGEVSGDLYVRHCHEWSYEIFGVRQFQTAYDWTWDGSFSFNLRTGSGHAVLDVGRGVKLDTRKIEAVLRGDLTHLLESVPTFGVTKKEFHDEYERIRNSFYRDYGQQNVYFASEQFVGWATPETAGRMVFNAIMTGGESAAAGAMREISHKALEELNSLTAWLQRKGVMEAVSVARLLLEGQRVDWPFLAVKWQTVNYESRTVVAGVATPWISVRLAAFVIIWKGGNRSGEQSQRPKPDAQSHPQRPAPHQTPPQVEQHTAFQYGGGMFHHLGGGRWVDRRSDGSTLNLTEVGRTGGVVELFQREHKTYIRILHDRAESSNDRRNWRPFNGSHGRWVK